MEDWVLFSRFVGLTIWYCFLASDNYERVFKGAWVLLIRSSQGTKLTSRDATLMLQFLCLFKILGWSRLRDPLIIKLSSAYFTFTWSSSGAFRNITVLVVTVLTVHECIQIHKRCLYVLWRPRTGEHHNVLNAHKSNSVHNVTGVGICSSMKCRPT
jgi:hypothetical protein